MKNRLKSISVILIALIVTLSFCSCKKEGVTTVNGVPITEYTVIYKSGDMLSQYAAQVFADRLKEIENFEIPILPDSEGISENEILIGDTNRNEDSITDITMQNDEYAVFCRNKKIVLYANGYMVGGAANELLNRIEKDNKVKLSSKIAPQKYKFESPKNVILMIGDGMGVNHIEAAKQNGMPYFASEQFDNVGFVTTYSYSVSPMNTAVATDSAAAATAMATGVKTQNGYLGIDYLGKSITNVREIAAEKGAKTAVITTDVTTGATPSGFTVHVLNRDMTSEIKKQQDELVASNRITVLKGELDDNLLPETKEMLKTLSDGNSGYFAMIEEAYIDKNSHKNDFEKMIHTVKRFNSTVAYVSEFVLMHPDTALIVTADHETGGITKDGNGNYCFTTENHTNSNVKIFALGQNTEHFSKNTVDNTYIAEFIKNIFL